MAVDFNGDADFINIGSAKGNLDLNRSFSLLAWVKTDSTSTDQSIFSHGNGGWYIRLSSTNKIEFLKSQIASILTSTNTVGTVWVCVRFVMGAGSTATITLYKNGVSDGSTTTSQDVTNAGGDNWIGQDFASSNRFNGKIGEVHVWNVELTASQVLDYYKSRIKGYARQISPSNLVGSWYLNDHPNGSTIGGKVYKDSSSSGYDGTATDANSNSTNVAEEVLSYSDFVRSIGVSTTITIDQEGFRWRDDDNNEASATWLESQDTNITRNSGTNTRLRTIMNATGDPASKDFQLEFRKQGDTIWQKVPVRN